MTKRVRTETPEQAERRRERNRQRRQAAGIAKVMERAAAANSRAVGAPKPDTTPSKATKAPQAPVGAVEAPKTPSLAQRAKEIGFKMGVNGKLYDLEGIEFFPFYPDDLLSSQAMLHNDAAIRGRAVGAMESLAEFLATRVAGRMPSKAEMRLARLIEGLAYELLAVADEIPRVLDKLDDLRRERDDLKRYKEDLIRQFSQYHGQYVLIDIPPQEPEAKPAKPIKERQPAAPVKPMKRVDLIAGGV